MKNCFFLILAVIAFLLGSGCALEKRHYRPGYHITRIPKTSKTQETCLAKKSYAPTGQNLSEIRTVVEQSSSGSIALAGDGKPEFSMTVKRALLVLLPPDSCDVIIMKSGEEVRGIILEIGTDNVRYRKCEHLDGPLYTTRKSDVFMIKYKSGRKEVIQQAATTPSVAETPGRTYSHAGLPAQAQPRKLLLGAVLSFCASAIGFFIAGILLGATGTILGITAIVKITKNPERYKGMAFAVLGVVLGLIVLILTMAYLSSR